MDVDQCRDELDRLIEMQGNWKICSGPFNKKTLRISQIMFLNKLAQL